MSVMGRPGAFPMLRIDHPTLEDYRAKLIMSNYTKYTIRDYVKFLRRVLGFSKKKSVRSLTQVDINLFLQYLQQEGVQARSIYKYVCASRNLIDTYRLNIDRRDLPKIRRHIEPKFTFLRPDEVSFIAKSAHSLRDTALITLAYECAMRVGEIQQTLVEDLDLVHSTLYIRTEKWGPKAVIPIMNTEVITILTLYLNEWNPTAASPLFPKTKGHRKALRTNYISTHIFQDLTVELGYKALKFHDLRHSRASFLSKCGVDMAKIQKFMRHRSITSTQGYIHLEPEDLRRDLEAITHFR